MSITNEQYQELKESIQWIINDMQYKAPEQAAGCYNSWRHKLINTLDKIKLNESSIEELPIIKLKPNSWCTLQEWKDAGRSEYEFKASFMKLAGTGKSQYKFGDIWQIWQRRKYAPSWMLANYNCYRILLDANAELPTSVVNSAELPTTLTKEIKRVCNDQLQKGLKDVGKYRREFLDYLESTTDNYVYTEWLERQVRRLRRALKKAKEDIVSLHEAHNVLVESYQKDICKLELELEVQENKIDKKESEEFESNQSHNFLDDMSPDQLD